MLVALFTILLLGGSTTGILDYISETTDAVKVVVPKGDEQKAALGTLKAMKKRAQAHNKVVKRTGKELDKTFSDHDSKADDIEAIWDAYFTEVDKHNHDMLDLRFELKESINREEWAEIFPDTEM